MNENAHGGCFCETWVFWAELFLFPQAPTPCGHGAQSAIPSNGQTRPLHQSAAPEDSSRLQSGGSGCRNLLFDLQECILHIQASQDCLLSSKCLLRLLPKVKEGKQPQSLSTCCRGMDVIPGTLTCHKSGSSQPLFWTSSFFVTMLSSP